MSNPFGDRTWSGEAWFAGGERIGYDPKARAIIAGGDAPLRIFIRQEGDPAHAVSFLPGFPDGSFGWTKVRPHLPNADEMPKLFLDYVGMGDNAFGFTERIKAALTTIAPESQALTVAQLAPLDQFHTRGILATAELAAAVGVDASTRVLDLGCGIGGPARYLAATFRCKVTGIDLSPGFIDAATYLTARCGLSDRVMFQVGDALDLAFDDASFDGVFLQHVAMNIADRTTLYKETRRILAPGGRLATYDLVLRDGDVVYPVPWARDALASFLLTESETRTVLEEAGYKAVLWRDDTEVALDWFKTVILAQRQSGPNLGLVMGPDFPVMTGNLARNLRENRLGVLSAVLIRD